jgi:putative hemolysin
MAEIAIVTARRARLNGLAARGNKGAEAAITLGRDPGRFLSTVQTGITLIGVLTGAIGGLTLTEPLTEDFTRWQWLGNYAHPLAFALVVIVTSYISVVIGELVPKQIGLRYAEPFAIVVAPIMLWLARVGAPIVLVLDVSSKVLLRLFGEGKYTAQEVTEDEVKTLVAEGAETGVFHPAEREMVTRVLRFADRTVRSIMTPRGDIAWLSESDDWTTAEAKIVAGGHMHFPLGGPGPEGLKQIKGVIYVRDLLLQRTRGEPFDLNALVKPMPVVHDGQPILEVLETLKAESIRIAVVVDEYGVVEGLVTMTDILEAVIGVLPDMQGGGEAPVESLSEGSWLMDGALPLDDVKMHLHLHELPGEDEVTTLGGFMLIELGHVPEVKDSAEYGGYKFTVIEMDGRRVDKVAVEKIEAVEK